MGLFDFLKGVGKKIAGGPSAEEIEKHVTEALGNQVEDLSVDFDDGTVTLSGTVESQATREKAVLLAGNVEGVEQVNDDGLTVKPQEKEEEVEEPAFTFYTIQSGDSLSKIARQYYGDAMKWPTLFEANREVIENPDLIYPGQQIRVPKNPDA